MTKPLINVTKHSFFYLAILMLAACAQEAAPPATTSTIGEMPAAELNNRIKNNTAPLIIDVRTSEEFASGHLPGALNIAHNEFVDDPAASIALLPTAKDAEMVVHCVSGKRAGIAMEVITAAGYTNVNHLSGDYSGWENAGYPVGTE